MNKLFSCVDALAASYKRLLQDIVSINSYSSDKASVDRVGAVIRRFAEKEGFHAQTVPFEKAGNGLLITCNEDAALPPVILTGHLDTVFPKGTFQEPLFREERIRISF